MECQTFSLPGGYFDSDGVRHREVTLSVLDGEHEEWLANSNLPSPFLVTRLLARTIIKIGTITDINEELTAKLLIADRDFIMLKLRQITFGDRVESTLPCPWPDCHGKIDIDFNISSIPITECDQVASFYEIELLAGENESGYQVRFRLPNGSDQLALAQTVDSNEAVALSELLKRCVLEVSYTEAFGLEEFHKNLTASQRIQIDKAMEAVAPNLDLTMELDCPHCNRQFLAPFQIQDFFFGELMIDSELLLREIHYLAFHYHWSESDILAMPKMKRRKYIDVLADEIGKMNDAYA